MGKDLEPFDLDGCAHEDLHFDFQVIRVVHEEGQNPHTIELEISCRCSSCGERMRFRGARHAITFREPNGDIFGWKLSAPMEPSGAYFTESPGGEAS